MSSTQEHPESTVPINKAPNPKGDGKPFPTDTANAEFERLAWIYSWDMRIEEATRRPNRLLLRVMDIGTLDDIVKMEQAIGQKALISALANAEVGSLRPQSWTFWHYRLGLVSVGQDCTSQPIRYFDKRPG